MANTAPKSLDPNRTPRIPPLEPPYPEPVGINDNEDDLPPAPRAQRRRLGVLQFLARVLIAPLYLGVAAAAIAVIALFVRGWLAV